MEIIKQRIIEWQGKRDIIPQQNNASWNYADGVADGLSIALEIINRHPNKEVQHGQPKQCKPFDYCDKRKGNCCGSWCPDYPAAG